MPGEIRTLSPEQLDRIRQVIEPTVYDWLRDYGLSHDKSHDQLVNRVVAAICSMHQCNVIAVQPGRK